MNEVFEEMRIGSLRAKNRLVRAATYERLATEDGHLTPELAGIYDELAASGVGTIIVSYASVTRDEQPNPRMLGIYDDSFVPEYRSLVAAAHARDVRMISQIVYGGSATKLDPPSARILGPSAVASPKTGVVPVEATAEDLRMLVEAFAAAARRAQEAGFDGVELHAAHGYLLSQFLSPHLNLRTDEYGGGIENRVRLGAEVLAAIRREVGGEFPILVKLNSSDGVEGGLTEDDSLAAARLFAEAGATAIEASGAWRNCRVRDFAGEPFFAAYARRLVREAGVPAILTGGNRSVAAMERLAREDGIAGFGLCRPLICEPDLPLRWAADPAYQPRCVSCGSCDNTHGHRCILPGTPQVQA
ncbi:NADH:flavin oxidoreductase [Arabiibacter massiliensis]|uniref:NADH:flavin oxidoreductase n=1 Tax=Arabiibacter massiliensis TaxID=1870985 RepID=UPI0009BBC1A3|nr:NADH:flavin oxidoreductase [Arabiibacter massiliensis]